MTLLTGVFTGPVEYKCMCAETGRQKCILHKICLKCGHHACPGCEDWCDVMLYKKEDHGNHCEVENPDDPDEYPAACCAGACTYE